MTKRTSAFGVLVAIILLPLAARAETYQFDASRSKISFSVRHLLGTAKGSFGKFSGVIELNREQPERSSVTATIHVRSLDTGIAKRDEHMRGVEFFNVEKFPEITFTSRSARRTGEQAGDIAGDFTMHGVTKPIVLHVKFLGFASAANGNQTTRWHVITDPIERYDYGLRWGEATERVAMIGRQVRVEMTIEAEPTR